MAELEASVARVSICGAGSSDATSARAHLRAVFDRMLCIPSYVTISFDILRPVGFSVPKDLDPGLPLLWTTQVELLWNKLSAPASDTPRGLILAGPSGIGKSHIVFLLALRAYAMGRPVLYVSDCGVAVNTGTLSDLALTKSFGQLNADVIETGVDGSLIEHLSRNGAVVFMDEHGHAYNKLRISSALGDVGQACPLLMPATYDAHARAIAFVFGGSNQAKFEADLNTTYRHQLHFVLPFADADAALFLISLYPPAPSPAVLHDMQNYCCYVPQEMRLLRNAGSVADYFEPRIAVMTGKLEAMVAEIKDDTYNMGSLVRTLTGFFRTGSMHTFVGSYSFLDLGYVFREGAPNGRYSARPLCRAAAVALVRLWNVVHVNPIKLIGDVKTGEEFEDAVFDMLLMRGFGIHGEALPCRPLGLRSAVEVQLLTWRLDSFRTASSTYCGSSKSLVDVGNEINLHARKCRGDGTTLLYRCPPNCAFIDFAVITPTKVYALQSSISSMTAHKRFNLGIISALYCVDFALFVYITTRAEEHAVLARQPRYKNVRIVDAREWCEYDSAYPAASSALRSSHASHDASIMASGAAGVAGLVAPALESSVGAPRGCGDAGHAHDIVPVPAAAAGTAASGVLYDCAPEAASIWRGTGRLRARLKLHVV